MRTPVISVMASVRVPELKKAEMVFRAEDQRKVLAGRERIRILACGRSGVGKSSLVNSLIGSEIMKVGDPGAENFPESHQLLDRCTTDVDSHNISINGVVVTVWDSPGLQDGTEDEEAYLNKMHQACGDVDIVLYCLQITETRWSQTEEKAMELLKNTFGVDFWKKAVLVLTKADMLQPREVTGKTTNEERKRYFLKMYEVLSDRFRIQLEKQGVPAEIASQVPAVATTSPMRPLLPNGKHFITEFWLACLERISAKSRINFINGTSALERIDPANSGHWRYHLKFDEEQKFRLSKILSEIWEEVKTGWVSGYSEFGVAGGVGYAVGRGAGHMLKTIIETLQRLRTM